MFTMKNVLFIIILYFLFFYNISAQIKINEIVASNSESCYDENMESSDWLELYNIGDNPVNLKNYRIFDKYDYENAWVLPDTIIEPDGHLLIFASGEDRYTSNKYILESSGIGLVEYRDEDGFGFEYLEITGDFDISVKFHSVRNDLFNTYAALMMREELDDESVYAAMVTQNQDRAGLLLFYREDEGEETKSKYFYNRETNFPYTRVRLTRKGDSVTGSIYDEGWIWYTKDTEIALSINDKVYLGVALGSSDNDHLSKLAFSELILNGDTLTAEDLTSIEINTGIKGKFYKSQEVHTNFKIDKEGEKLYLWNNSGEIIDSIQFPEQTTDVSYGRYPDGTDNIRYFFPATPEAENNNAYLDITPEPEFSNEGGWFNSIQHVSFLNNDDDVKIYYTLDGAEPDRTSNKYHGNTIRIDTTTMIRARAYKENNRESPIISNTYFINDSSALQVISLSADPDDLWNEEDGIFVLENRYNGKEIPVSFELWNKEKDVIYEAGAGAKLHGQLSKIFPQKSLRLYAKSKYGTTIFKYPFFGDSGLDEYERIILRNGGTEWWRTFLRDGFSAVVTEQMPALEAMAFTPSLMFINGTYYGIQNIRERIDETYIHLKYDLPYESINLMEDWGVLLYGSAKSFHVMYDSVLNYDMSAADAYGFIDRQVDIDNIIDYTAYEMYIANIDWPWKNLKFWQSTAYDSKWRWVLNDLDYTCGIASWPQYNFFPFSTDGKEVFSRFFPKLLENEKFRLKFINRSADLMNTVLKPDNMIRVLDSLADILRPEIPRQNERYDSSAVEWEHELDVMRDFLTRRIRFVPGHYVEYFDLTDTAHVTLNVVPEGAGRIKISTITPYVYPWEGVYFLGIPVEIKAVPNKGYAFSSWSDEKFYSSSITTFLTSFFNLSANFDKIDLDTNIVINEIMYKCNDERDSEDWIELYNAGEKDMDISGWIMKDDNNEHSFTIPDNTILEKDGYLVLCRENEAFSENYPEILNYTGEFEFGLGENDMVRLFDKNGTLIDMVEYSYQSPWPGNSNGTGYSLELNNPVLDNNRAENWQSSYQKYGTPGEKNSVLVDTGEQNSNLFSIDIYPNPFSDNCRIELKTKEMKKLTLNLYNSYGELVKSIIDNKSFNWGSHSIELTSTGLSSGMYYIKAESGDMVKTIPVVIMR
jgi:hypothetical protein